MTEKDIRVAATQRRTLLKTTLGLGAVAAAVPGRWSKPVINTVLLPVHAQTSPVCPMIVVGNVVFGPQSPVSSPPVCTTSFDVLSSDASTDLNIVSVTNGPLGSDVSVTYGSFGVATATTGPRVIWAGPASDAPFCSDNMPIEDVVFTVTASCAAVSGQFTQDFLLSDIVALAS